MKKKKKKRYAQGLFRSKQSEITEQQYIDQQFKNLQNTVDALWERIGILETLNEKEHIFIHPINCHQHGDKVFLPVEAREWAREHGYKYIEGFKTYGELWVKNKQEEAKDAKS